MESRGMALRSKRAPQFAEVFRCEATAQDIEEDLEKMTRGLTRLKRRRMQRAAAPEVLTETPPIPKFDKSDGGFKKAGSPVEEGSDESQSRGVKSEFRPWTKFDPMNYHHTFQ